MANITVLVPQNAEDFCKLYRKLQKLLGKPYLKLLEKDLVGDMIDTLVLYVATAGGSMVVSFNLEQAVKRNELPDLRLYYQPGNLHFSKTLEELQEQFPLPKELEDDEDLITESSVNSRFSPKPSTKRLSDRKKKVKPTVPITS